MAQRIVVVLLTVLISGALLAQSNPPRPSAPKGNKSPQTQSAKQQNTPKTDERGTEQSPLIVKVLPTPNAQVDTQGKGAAQKKESPHNWWPLWEWSPEWALVAITGLLFIVTTALAIFTAWLWLATKELAGDARNVAGTQAAKTDSALAIAKDSAESARDQVSLSREALIHTDRAFVFIKTINSFFHYDPVARTYFWSIHPIWENSGNTPTRQLRVNVRYELRGTALPDGFDFPSAPGSQPLLIGPKGILEANEGRISGTDLAAVGHGTKFFYFWGWATYRDVFDGTPQHITRFCYVIDRVMGHPENPDMEDRRTSINCALYHEHNCADDECHNWPPPTA